MDKSKNTATRYTKILKPPGLAIPYIQITFTAKQHYYKPLRPLIKARALTDKNKHVYFEDLSTRLGIRIVGRLAPKSISPQTKSRLAVK